MNIFKMIHDEGDDANFDTKRLPAPTDFIPGSPQKVEVLVKRLERGQVLFHPEDKCTMDGHVGAPEGMVVRREYGNKSKVKIW